MSSDSGAGSPGKRPGLHYLCLDIKTNNSYVAYFQLSNLKMHKLCPQMYLFTAILKGLLALISVLMIFSLYQYYSGELRVMRIKRYLIRGQTGVLTSPMAILFVLECLLCCLHIPPGVETKFQPEWQLIPMIRLYQDEGYNRQN